LTQMKHADSKSHALSTQKSGVEALGAPALRHRVVAGVAWMVLFKLVDRGIGLISILVLARLLLPSDFGLVAMATAVMALLELFSAFSFDVALIGNRNLTREHYDTAWTLNAMAGLAIASMIWALAWPAGIFYHEPRLTPMMLVLGFASAVQGCENIGVVMFRRELNFRKEFTFLMLKRLATVFIVIPAAFLLRSHWALIIGLLFGRVISVLLSYLIHPYRPRRCLSARRELLGFSGWMLLNNMLGFLKERSPDFIIGRVLGPGPLGLYGMGTEIANIPTSEMSGPLNRALLPGYAAVANRGPALQQAYLNSLGTIALFVMPAGLGLLATASALVGLMLGDRWTASVPVLQIMSVHGVIMALQAIGYTVMLASNRPHIPARVNIAHVLIVVTLLLIFTPLWGIRGAAIAYLGTALITSPINYYFVLQALQLRVSSLQAALWRPLTAALVMAGAIWMMRRQFWSRSPETLGALLAEVAIGAITYTAILVALWIVSGRPAGAERLAVAYVESRFGRQLAQDK
jgi:lipopolysaccharide exporter